MNFNLDPDGAARAVRRLRDAFEGRVAGGIFGVVQKMPEEDACKGIRSELDRLLLLTFTVAIDYHRDAHALWAHARRLYEDPATRWVFEPRLVAARSVSELLHALESKGRLRYPDRDTAWWLHNGRTLARRYGGNPRVIFERSGWNALRIRQEVAVPGRFKGLKGTKIFPLWLRMVSDILGYRFSSLEALPIPADIHITRASFAIGLLRGRYRGSLDDTLKDAVREAWRVLGSRLEGGWVPYDEPLWQLSRLGCRKRHLDGLPDCPMRGLCPVGETCVRGTVKVFANHVEIDT